MVSNRVKIQLSHGFENIISVDNLLSAWREFIRGKRKRLDVQEFSLRLMDNILDLHQDLKSLTYKHGGYQAFKINDPKPRDIHKASVRDRLLHYAIYRILYPFFDKIFIADSYSCRLEKGTHKAVNRFREFTRKASKNNTRTCWVLKCDIRKFFANIGHSILLNLLQEYIPDKNIIKLLENVIGSFTSSRPLLSDERENANIGLPLGNLTSQLFVNIYMNKFDQFVKHRLKAEYYVRYADDFIILSPSKFRLKNILVEVGSFSREKLKLRLHPDKISIRTVASGVDFLGWINFPHRAALRTKTKRRMMSRLKKNPTPECLASYLGLLKHGNTFKLQQEIRNNYWLWS